MANVTSPTKHPPQAALPQLTWMDFWLFVLMIMWGANITLLKSLIQQLSPFVVNAVRFSTATLTLFILFKAQGIRLTLPRRDWPILILISFGGQLLYQVVWLFSLKQTTVANNALLLTTVPIWVVMFNAWRGHERFRRRGFFGLFLAICGVSLVIVSGGEVGFDQKTIIGDLLTLAASLIWAGVLILSREPYKRNPPLPVAFWTMAWGAFFQVLLVLLDPKLITPELFKPPVLLAVLFSGILSLGIGNMIWIRAINIMGTGRPAIYTYLEIIAASGTAVILLGEPLTIWLVFGGLLVVCGVIIVKSS